MEKKKFGYNLNNFSQARMFIYALSIFMIVIFHSGLTIGGSGTFHQILTTTKSYLFYAVDIFFIMSGISLYFSYSKDENPIAFLKRRFKRLLPYYLVIYTIVFVYQDIICNFNPLEFILDITTINYWIKGMCDVPWFLTAIIFFYLLYPLLYKIFYTEYANKQYYKLLTIFGMLLFAIIGIKAVPQAWDIWIRIPAMLIGVLLGKYVKDGKTINGLVFGIITGCIAVFSTYIQLNFATQYSLMLFLPANALFTIFIFSFIFKFNKKCLPFMNKIIGFFGAFTFEIYITHERTQQYLYRILNSMFNLQISYSNNWYQLSAIIIAIIISIGLSKLIGLIIKKIENKKKLKKDITQKP